MEEGQMDHHAMQALARAIETGTSEDPDFVRAVLKGVRTVFPQAGADAAVLTSTEAALSLLRAAFGGWRIELQGQALAPAGGWQCTIRETGTRDDDEVIGLGRAATVPLALIAAMLLAQARRAQGYV
jgi:hypothetical protein